MLRRNFLAAAIIAPALASCSSVIPDAYNFVLSVEIEAGGKRLRQSVVRQHVRRSPIPGMGSMDLGSTRVLGEALVFDLGGGRLLVFTLRGYHRDPLTDTKQETATPWTPDSVSFASVPVERRFQGRVWPWWRWRRVLALSANDLPVAVTFDNARDPMTVKAVDAADLADAFGKSVRLVRAEVRTSDQKVTWGRARHYLPWLSKSAGEDAGLDGDQIVFSTRLSDILRLTDFERQR